MNPDHLTFIFYMAFLGLVLGFFFAILKHVLIDPFLRKTP